ncbi:MAG: DUF424 family protein [Nanoarchaeota archaeon]|nr:DUF424 family protein [Nanoarchaeota archaeon]
MISVKIHRSYREVVAIADSDLIGKIFEEGNLQLNVKENFYKDKELNFEEAVELMIDQKKEDATFNIIGKNAVSAALEAGIISEEGINEVQDIPFALVLL